MPGTTLQGFVYTQFWGFSYFYQSSASDAGESVQKGD